MTAPPPGSLGEEARRLAEAIAGWSQEHGAGFVAGAGTAQECRYCPLCQLIGLARGDRPEVAARLAEAGRSVAEALRTLLVPPGTDEPDADHGAADCPPAGPDPAGAPHRVQRIDVG